MNIVTLLYAKINFLVGTVKNPCDS